MDADCRIIAEEFGKGAEWLQKNHCTGVGWLQKNGCRGAEWRGGSKLAWYWALLPCAQFV